MEYRKELESVSISKENGSLVYGVRYRVGLFDTALNRWTSHSGIEGVVFDDARPEDAASIAEVTKEVNAQLPVVVAEREAAIKWRDEARAEASESRSAAEAAAAKALEAEAARTHAEKIAADAQKEVLALAATLEAAQKDRDAAIAASIAPETKEG